MPFLFLAADPTSVAGGTTRSGVVVPHNVFGPVLRANLSSVESPPRSLAVIRRFCSSASESWMDDDDEDVVVVVALLEVLSDATDTAAFLLSLRPRYRTAPNAITAAASTPTTIHFVLLAGGAAAG